jgi:hypothetical protein
MENFNNNLHDAINSSETIDTTDTIDTIDTTDTTDTMNDKSEYIDSMNNDEMYDISFGLPDVLFTLTFNNSVYNEKITPLISKIFIVRQLSTVNLLLLSNVLVNMKIEKLNIFSIDMFSNENEVSKKVIVDSPMNIQYAEFSYKTFLERISTSVEGRSAFQEYNKDTLYILRGGSYIDIKNLFKNIEGNVVNVGRGGSQKSHMLSPLDFRLSTYIMAMFSFDYKYISYINTFNDITKNRYLPFNENTSNLKTTFKDGKLVNKSISNVSYNTTPSNSRKYTTSVTKNIVNDNVHAKNSEISNLSNISVSSYLDQIDDIIKNSSSLYDAQKEIETS